MGPRRAKRSENPGRLIKLLTRIRTDIFQVSRAEMAEMLENAQAAEAKARKLSSGSIRETEKGATTADVVEQTHPAKTKLGKFSAESIRNIEEGTTLISYYHVAAYGNLLKVPTGILLLFSRYSKATPKPEKEFKEFNEILSHFLIMSNQAWQERGFFSIQDLHEMSKYVHSRVRREDL